MRPLRIAASVLLAAFLTLSAVRARAGDDFPPVRPLELAMKTDPSNPDAAEILYHESDTNNLQHYRTEYYRIRIFTEAGKKYGDVEVRYDREFLTISDVKARTVRPDGTIVPFNGKVFDKVIAKRRGIDVRATAFSLSDVQAGCIIEYRYRLNWERNVWFMPRWIVQDDLPTLQAHFSMNIPPGTRLAYLADALPSNADWVQGIRGALDLTVSNIPPFAREEYTPFDEGLRMRVLFYLAPEQFSGEDEYWKDVGKDLYKRQQSFAEPRRGVTDEVARLVQPSDPPEAKLRKLYARAQQIHDLSYERWKTEAEQKRANVKRADNAEQVLAHGYAYRNQINATFVALARAAGFDAAMVNVAERDDAPFDSRVLDPDQVPWLLAVVKLGEEERFFDPGTPGCPFGLVPWEDIQAKRLRPTPDGVQYITTPVPKPEASQRLRKAELTLAEDGSLQGHVSLTYTGLFALDERLRSLFSAEVERRKQIEDEIRGWLPSQSQLKLDKVTGWEDSGQPIQIEATLDVPNMATAAGGRVILAADVFEVNRTNPFVHPDRKWDVAFEYPYSLSDGLTLHLPARWQVEALPPSQEVGAGPMIGYQVSRRQAGADLQIQRRMHLDQVIFENSFYPALRQFYSRVGASGEDPVVLRASAPPN